jgi:hypothetical protein
MTGHKFKVGETVYFRSGKSGSYLLGPAGPFQITRRSPESDGDFQYQVKSAVESHERAALEKNLTSRPPAVKPVTITIDNDNSTTKKIHKKSKGNLLKDFRRPIYVEFIGLWTPPDTEIRRLVNQQVDERLKALITHFNIPARSTDKWWYLSFCLAQELKLMTVTFEGPKGPGKPRVWFGSKTERRLVQRMDEEIGRGLGKSDAAENLIEKYPDDYGRLTPKSLVNRWGEAKRRERLGSQTPLSEQHWLIGRRSRRGN